MVLNIPRSMLSNVLNSVLCLASLWVAYSPHSDSNAPSKPEPFVLAFQSSTAMTGVTSEHPRRYSKASLASHPPQLRLKPAPVRRMWDKAAPIEPIHLLGSFHTNV